ncbi:MAG: hypothetical protein ABSH46_12075 [Bryobacteraceae bacterium]|jgi:hypothetical protein
MRTLLVAMLLVTFLAAPAAAGDPDFHAIVRGVESGYGVHRVHIPLFGLARFVVNVAQPEGVKDFDMAIFETRDGPPPDSSRFDAIVKRAGGEQWSSVIRVRSRRSHEWVYIYARPEGRDWRMLIATFGPSETVILQARVDAEFLANALDDPDHAGQSLNGPHDER